MPSRNELAERWKRLVDRVRENPELPFDEQLREFRFLVAEQAGPPAVWSPSAALLRDSNVGRAIRERGFESTEVSTAGPAASARPSGVSRSSAWA